MKKLTLGMIPKIPVELSSPSMFEPKFKNSTYDDYNVDLDVYLPTRGFNLQRESCWTLEQKQKLILSIFQQRPIPPLHVNRKADKKTYEIIDGKQRYLALIEFQDNKFPLSINGENYYFRDIEDKDKWRINHFTFDANYHYEHQNLDDTILTDEDKIRWFLFVNDSGTPQQDEYLKSLNNILKSI